MTKSRIQQSPAHEEDADDLPIIQDSSEEEDSDEVGREGTEKPMGTEDGHPDVDREDLWDAKQKAIITEGELGILMNGKARWMGYKGSGRKDFFDQMVEELRKLEELESLSGDDWDRRIKAYGSWLSNHSRKESTQGRLKVGCTWNVRSVVQETHRNDIKEWIKDRNDVQLGSKAAISLHQKELTEYLGELSDEEIQAAQQLANSWNLKDGPPADIKAKCAEEKGGDLMEEFAREMWRSCGMRMVIITGFKNQKGHVMTAIGDINDTFKGGSKFANIDEIGEEWQEFVTDQFSIRGRAVTVDDRDSDDVSVPPEAAPVGREKKPDAALSVTRADGEIWVPDITGKTRDEIQRMVRGYLTAKYRLACGNPKVSAPFKKLPAMFRKMIHGRHLPPEFTFPSDPSHMKVEDARAFLTFIVDRQESDPSDSFEFHRWLNDKGELMQAGETETQHNGGDRRRKGDLGKQSDKRTRQRSTQVATAKGNVDEESQEESEKESDATRKKKKKSRQGPYMSGRSGEDAVPPPSNQLSLKTIREVRKASDHPDSEADSTPRPAKDKERRVHPQNLHEGAGGGNRQNPDRYDDDTEENWSDVDEDNRDIRGASKHTRTAHMPRVIETPRTVFDDKTDGNPDPSAGRRSTRARKVPKARDADFPTPSQRGGHKRKNSGNGKDVGKRLRVTQRS